MATKVPPLAQQAIRVKNLDGEARRVIPLEPVARLEKLRWLLAVEGWDEVKFTADVGWVPLETAITELGTPTPAKRSYLDLMLSMLTSNRDHAGDRLKQIYKSISADSLREESLNTSAMAFQAVELEKTRTELKIYTYVVTMLEMAKKEQEQGK